MTKKIMRTRRTKAKGTVSPTAARARKRRAARKQLEWWIDGDLAFYVKDFISDSDYRQLRKNMCDIAEAYATNQQVKPR